MSDNMMKVEVAGGKYTVVQDATGRLSALRHGEPWRDCCGDSLIFCLAAELEDARHALAVQAEAYNKQVEALNQSLAFAEQKWREYAADYTTADAACAENLRTITRRDQEIKAQAEQLAARDKDVARLHGEIRDLRTQLDTANQKAELQFKLHTDQYNLAQKAARDLDTANAAAGEMRQLLPLIECKCDTASRGGYVCPRCKALSTQAGTSLLRDLEQLRADCADHAKYKQLADDAIEMLRVEVIRLNALIEKERNP